MGLPELLRLSIKGPIGRRDRLWPCKNEAVWPPLRLLRQGRTELRSRSCADCGWARTRRTCRWGGWRLGKSGADGPPRLIVAGRPRQYASGVDGAAPGRSRFPRHFVVCVWERSELPSRPCVDCGQARTGRSGRPGRLRLGRGRERMVLPGRWRLAMDEAAWPPESISVGRQGGKWATGVDCGCARAKSAGCPSVDCGRGGRESCTPCCR